MDYEDKYINKLETAPATLVEAINIVKPEEKILSIGSGAGLSIDQMGALEHVVDMYVYGAITSAELPDVLVQEVPSAQPILAKLIDSININIAIPIQKEMQQQNEEEDMPLIPVLRPEELNLESDKPEFWQEGTTDEEVYTQEVDELKKEGVFVDDLQETQEGVYIKIEEPTGSDTSEPQQNQPTSISNTEHKTLQNAGIVVDGAPIPEVADDVSLTFIKRGFEQPQVTMNTGSDHSIPKINVAVPVPPTPVAVPVPPSKDPYHEPIE